MRDLRRHPRAWCGLGLLPGTELTDPFLNRRVSADAIVGEADDSPYGSLTATELDRVPGWRYTAAPGHNRVTAPSAATR